MRRLLPLTPLLAAAVLAACGADGEPEAVAPEPSVTLNPDATGEAPAVEPGARTTLTATLADGTQIAYTLLLPEDYEPGREIPILLAMPPGGQGIDEVDSGLDLYWADGAERGWAIVSPVAPGALFFEGSERYIPELLDQVAASYTPEGGGFHLAGISNGGLSAFRLALDYDGTFLSLLTVPGNPPENEDYELLDRLTDIPVAMYVGGNDEGWLQASERTAQELTDLGGEVALNVLFGKGHILTDLPAGQLFDFLDSARPEQ